MNILQTLSLKDLLQGFIQAHDELGESAGVDIYEEGAVGKLEAIAGELNRRFYVSEEYLEALELLVDALFAYLLAPTRDTGALGGEEQLGQNLELIRAKLRAHD